MVPSESDSLNRGIRSNLETYVFLIVSLEKVQPEALL